MLASTWQTRSAQGAATCTRGAARDKRRTWPTCPLATAQPDLMLRGWPRPPILGTSGDTGTQAFGHTHSHAHPCSHTRTHTFVHTHVHTHADTLMHTCAHTCNHTHMHTHMQMDTCAHTRNHTHTPRVRQASRHKQRVGLVSREKLVLKAGEWAPPSQAVSVPVRPCWLLALHAEVRDGPEPRGGWARGARREGNTFHVGDLTSTRQE